MKPDEITKALNWRYAVQAFDTEKKVSDADLETILESARLAPSSFGIEPWKFVVVKNADVRAKLRAAGYDQPKITEASDLIIVAQRTDAENMSAELIARVAAAQGVAPEALQGYKDMVDGAVARNTPVQNAAWLRSQTYIALGIMIETASLIGVDNAPMEGFNNAQVDEILGLAEQNLTSVSMLALGYRATEARPKARRAYGDVVQIVA